MSKKMAFSRRQFLGGAAATAGLMVLPRYVMGGQPGTAKAPSDRVNWALIGNGTRGGQQAGGNIAICDVDAGRGKYQDYRKMIDEMDKSLDAVLIATPDHNHAVIAMEAIKRHKHVYCEKPLAHSIGEVRALGKAAKENKVVTQLGNQGHSYETCSRCVEWVRDGAIGKIKEVHAIYDGCYSDRTTWTNSRSSTRFPPAGLGPLARPGPDAVVQPDVPAGQRGGTGCSSAPAPRATGSATPSTRRSGPWNSSTPPASRRRSTGSTRRLHVRHVRQGQLHEVRVPGQGQPRPGHAVLVRGRLPHAPARRAGRGPGQPRGGVMVGDKGGITSARTGPTPFRIVPRGPDAGLPAKPGYAAPRARRRPSSAAASNTRTGWTRSARAGRPVATSPTTAAR